MASRAAFHSDWCKRELSYALSRGKKRLTVYLEECNPPQGLGFDFATFLEQHIYGYQVTEEELASALQDMAKSYALSREQLNEMIGENGAELVAQDIVSQKVLHFLNESAKEIVE